MATIICSYCQYVGSGESYNEQIDDVEEHEKTCKENPDYQEDKYEYELCEITSDGANLLGFDYNSSEWSLYEAQCHPNYAGCLYEDGNIGPMPPMYSVKGSTNRGYFAPFADLKAGTAHIHKATHVVFKKA